eukprot:TRINITY_DN620_c0_g1_i1.p1 TRINITY_DN620_c0_g1~~TRINITY_DN620_c0_g1_i1.p1  ORF type:complete len:1394 (-),score=357.69 TRINITY_DN620_c0_g1_i1:6-4160(-)
MNIGMKSRDELSDDDVDASRGLTGPQSMVDMLRIDAKKIEPISMSERKLPERYAPSTPTRSPPTLLKSKTEWLMIPDHCFSLNGMILSTFYDNIILFASENHIVLTDYSNGRQCLILAHATPISHLTLFGEPYYYRGTEYMVFFSISNYVEVAKRFDFKMWFISRDSIEEYFSATTLELERIQTLKHQCFTLSLKRIDTNIDRVSHMEIDETTMKLLLIGTSSGKSIMEIYTLNCLAEDSFSVFSSKHFKELSHRIVKTHSGTLNSPIRGCHLLSSSSNAFRYITFNENSLYSHRSYHSNKITSHFLIPPKDLNMVITCAAPYYPSDFELKQSNVSEVLENTPKLLVGTTSGYILIIDLQENKIKATMRLHDDSISQIIVGSAFVATCSLDRTVRLWSPDFLELLLEAPLRHGIIGMKFSGSKIFIKTITGTAVMIDYNAKMDSTLLRSHQTPIDRLTFQKIRNVYDDYKLLSLSSGENCFKLWSFETNTQSTEFHVRNDIVIDIEFYNKYLIICMLSGILRVLDTETFEILFEQALQNENSVQAVILKTQMFLNESRSNELCSICLSSEGELFILDLTKFQNIGYVFLKNFGPQTFGEHSFGQTFVDMVVDLDMVYLTYLSENKDVILVSINIKTLKIWKTLNISNLINDKKLQTHLTKCKLFVSVDHNYLYLFSKDIFIFDLMTLSLVDYYKLNKFDYVVDVSPNFKYMVIGCSNGQIEIYGINNSVLKNKFSTVEKHITFLQKFAAHHQNVGCLLFSPDGKYLISTAMNSCSMIKWRFIGKNIVSPTVQVDNYFKTNKVIIVEEDTPLPYSDLNDIFIKQQKLDVEEHFKNRNPLEFHEKACKTSFALLDEDQEQDKENSEFGEKDTLHFMNLSPMHEHGLNRENLDNDTLLELENENKDIPTPIMRKKFKEKLAQHLETANEMSNLTLKDHLKIENNNQIIDTFSYGDDLNMSNLNPSINTKESLGTSKHLSVCTTYPNETEDHNSIHVLNHDTFNLCMFIDEYLRIIDIYNNSMNVQIMDPDMIYNVTTKTCEHFDDTLFVAFITKANVLHVKKVDETMILKTRRIQLPCSHISNPSIYTSCLFLNEGFIVCGDSYGRVIIVNIDFNISDEKAVVCGQTLAHLNLAVDQILLYTLKGDFAELGSQGNYLTFLTFNKKERIVNFWYFSWLKPGYIVEEFMNDFVHLKSFSINNSILDEIFTNIDQIQNQLNTSFLKVVSSEQIIICLPLLNAILKFKIEFDTFKAFDIKNPQSQNAVNALDSPISVKLDQIINIHSESIVEDCMVLKGTNVLCVSLHQGIIKFLDIFTGNRIGISPIEITEPGENKLYFDFVEKRLIVEDSRFIRVWKLDFLIYNEELKRKVEEEKEKMQKKIVLKGLIK